MEWNNAAIIAESADATGRINRAPRAQRRSGDFRKSAPGRSGTRFDMRVLQLEDELRVLQGDDIAAVAFHVEPVDCMAEFLRRYQAAARANNKVTLRFLKSHIACCSFRASRLQCRSSVRRSQKRRLPGLWSTCSSKSLILMRQERSDGEHVHFLFGIVEQVGMREEEQEPPPTDDIPL